MANSISNRIEKNTVASNPVWYALMISTCVLSIKAEPEL